MKRKQVENMLDLTGIEYRYHHFKEREAIDPPFIVWLVADSDNFAADGIAYYKIDKLNIEVYTDEKDFDLEEKIETILTQHDIYFDKTESFIESETMYEVLYEMEV